jgi:hypothetical protein
MSLFNDALLASDIKINLSRIYEDTIEGEVVESLTGLALERTSSGLNVHLGGKITHIDHELFPHLFVGCKGYNGNSLLKFASFLRKNKNDEASHEIIVTLVDELMHGSELSEQIYQVLKHVYGTVHIITGESNKITCVGELPGNSELIMKRTPIEAYSPPGVY